MIEVKSSTIWQNDVTAEWKEYARTLFQKYGASHRKGIGNKVEIGVIVSH